MRRQIPEVRRLAHQGSILGWDGRHSYVDWRDSRNVAMQAIADAIFMSAQKSIEHFLVIARIRYLGFI